MTKTRGELAPIMEALAERRQEHARHYGVHPYFTRRPANVVAAYIDHYTEPGDLVLDPFGGSGVTAIEAILHGRNAIHNDLNPFANFLCRVIGDTSLDSTIPLRRAFERVENKCLETIALIEKASPNEIEKMLSQATLPENVPLPRNSDADFYYDLFTPRQLAGLAFIKAIIEEESDRIVRDHLLLAWSATLAKLNKTFLSAKGRAESRGGSSIFSIYRYKLAKDVIELPIWETFKGRFMNVVAAKDEVLTVRDVRNGRRNSENESNDAGRLRVIQEDAAGLVDSIGKESVDYIFTDPPYGGFIAYLDLSVLWNHWLGFRVSEAEKRAEAIVGGEPGFSENHYVSKLRDSVAACADLLRPDRWFSIVFQHWNIQYFQTILETALEHRLELSTLVHKFAHVFYAAWSADGRPANSSFANMSFRSLRVNFHANGVAMLS